MIKTTIHTEREREEDKGIDWKEGVKETDTYIEREKERENE